MNLRPYQQEAVQAAEDSWNNGFKSPLIVCPHRYG